MEIRLIFFKEIVGLISLKTERKQQYEKHLRSREEKSSRRFFLPKASLISILQKSSENSRLSNQLDSRADDFRQNAGLIGPRNILKESQEIVRVRGVEERAFT